MIHRVPNDTVLSLIQGYTSALKKVHVPNFHNLFVTTRLCTGGHTEENKRKQSGVPKGGAKKRSKANAVCLYELVWNEVK